jgi:hypothetical protein
MLKLISLSAALSAAAVIVSVPQIVFSRPLSQSSGYPVVRNSNAGSFFCYMRTQRGVTLNLENLCRADDGSGSANMGTNVGSNPATTNPATTNPATTNPNTTVFTFTGTPNGDITSNGTNTGANTNFGGTNTGANTNLGNTNTGANTNFGGTNTGANTNFGGTSTGANTNTNLGNTNTSTSNQQ